MSFRSSKRTSVNHFKVLLFSDTEKLGKWIEILWIRVGIGLLLLDGVGILRNVVDFQVPGVSPGDPWLFIMTRSL